MPCAATVPALSSTTSSTGTRELICASEPGLAFCLIVTMQPCCVDEQHVERQQRVLHPHRDVLGRVVNEDHRLVGPHLAVLDEHEALLARLRRIGAPGLEQVTADAGAGFDGDAFARERAERQRACGRGAQRKRQQCAKCEQQAGGQCGRGRVGRVMGVSVLRVIDERGHVETRDQHRARVARAECASRLRAVAAGRQPVSTVVTRDRFLPHLVERALVVALRRVERACALAHERHVGRDVARRCAWQRLATPITISRGAESTVALVDQAHAIAARSRATEALRNGGCRPVDLGIDRALQARAQEPFRRGCAEELGP